MFYLFSNVSPYAPSMCYFLCSFQLPSVQWVEPCPAKAAFLWTQLQPTVHSQYLLLWSLVLLRSTVSTSAACPASVVLHISNCLSMISTQIESHHQLTHSLSTSSRILPNQLQPKSNIPSVQSCWITYLPQPTLRTSFPQSCVEADQEVWLYPLFTFLTENL